MGERPGMIATLQWVLPLWAQIVIAIAAVLVAMNLIWTKVLRPGSHMIATMDKMLPLLVELTRDLENTPHAFKILRDIIAEFRTDSGSTLRDVVNRIEAAANENRTAAKVLEVNVESARMLSEQDRKQIARLMALLDAVSAKVELSGAGVTRLEVGGKKVAKELDAAQTRAEETQGDAGAAADAAMRRK